jgi:alpha-glucosidase
VIAEESALRFGHAAGDLVACGHGLVVKVRTSDCRIQVTQEGATILEDEGYAGGTKLTRLALDGERFYGLGLRTGTSLDRRGRIFEMWNTDAYDSAAGGFRPDADPLYGSVPFYIGLRDRAYGVFTDTTFRARFDMAKTDPARVVVSAGGASLDQYLIAGPHIRDVVMRYTALTGRIPEPPRWALGYHQSRWEGPCEGSPKERPFCSQAQILEVADAFRARKIPVDALWLDIQHMRGFRTFTFDPSRFPDPADLVKKLEARGIKTTVIIDPAIKIDDAWDVYQAGVSGGHFLPFTGEVWPGPSMFPDFTAKKTRAWWSDRIEQTMRLGVSGAWIDMNEPSNFVGGTVPETVPVDGDGVPTTMAEAHNVYAHDEARATYEGMRRVLDRPFILSRAAYAGQQRWSALWTGDAPSTWATLEMTLPMLLHLGLSGFAMAGSDVGGYSGRDTSPELFARWMSVGSISPFFRGHAEKDARRQEPWAFGDDVEDAAREAIGLRYELLPYLAGLAHQASETGEPILRPLVYEFQDDARARDIADQAMLGPSILVAPAMQGARKVHLPPGRWYELRSGAMVEGDIDLGSLPLAALPMYARAGAVIPRIDRVQHTGEKPGVLHVDLYPGQGRFTLDDGTDLVWTGKALEVSNATLPIRVHVKRAETRSATVDGAPVSFEKDDLDTVIDVGKKSFELVLDASEITSAPPVRVPIRVKLPAASAGTIHVATSATSWTHVPLQRTGDVAHGFIDAPRGEWVLYKITRGGWPTVEKFAGCAERPNRAVFGSTRAVEIAVAAWADGC